jgi:hypothetical protein
VTRNPLSPAGLAEAIAADLTDAGGPMFDPATADYLRRCGRLLDGDAITAAGPWLTSTCPECAEPVEGDGLVIAPEGTHAHVVIAGYVLLGCEGYFVISPAVLGIDRAWSDWTQDGN